LKRLAQFTYRSTEQIINASPPEMATEEGDVCEFGNWLKLLCMWFPLIRVDFVFISD